MTAAEIIDQNRQKIDEIDRQIVDLLNQRALCALAIGRSKKNGGIPEFAPEREKTIMRALEEHNRGPLSSQSVRVIFAEIISACRAVQRPLRVAYLGPENTFTHMSAMRHFGSSCEFRPHRSIVDVFHEVTRGHSQVGVVPVENSSEGGVSVTLDLFMDSELSVCGEVFARISQVLMAPGEEMREIQRVYSHPQGLNQCRDWLARNLPSAILVETSSTAEAARRSAEEGVGTAAVGSILAARAHNLQVLAKDVQDNPYNMTRFFVIGRQECPVTGNDKTSLLFITKHQPGTLFGALQYFSERGINMTRIESRPIKTKPWEYAFFVDFQGHVSEENVQGLLKDLESKTTFMKLLGSYPMGEPAGLPMASEAVANG